MRISCTQNKKKCGHVTYCPYQRGEGESHQSRKIFFRFWKTYLFTIAPTPLNFSFRYEIKLFLATTIKVEKLWGSIVCLTQWQINDHHSLRIQWAHARSFASIVLSKYPPAKCFRWLGFLCAWLYLYLYLYFHFYFYLYWQIQPDCMWMMSILKCL